MSGKAMGGGAAVLGALCVLAGLLAGPGVVALPFGPPWGALSLAFDPLSRWFLLVLGVAAVPAGLFAAQAGMGRVQAALLPPFVAAMALTVAAADLLTLFLGFEAMSLLSWAMIAAGGRRRAARLYLGFAMLSGLALLGAMAVLAPSGLSFAAIRAAPPEGARAVLLLALLLAGMGAKAGLVPLHAWLPVAHPAAPTALSALMSAAMVKVALYVMLRGLLDLAGPAQPAWWGLPLLVLGALSAVWGAIRANVERDVKAVLACSTLEHVGLIALAIGLCLLFRGADLRPLAALALSAALLHALVHALAKTALFLGAGAVMQLAGTRDAGRLGGLLARMPLVAACTGLAAATAAALPPLAGFASEWLLLQSLLHSWRLAEMAFQLLGAAALAAAALAAALGAAAMLRLFGAVFLGRPRTPRAAGALDAGGLLRAALLLPAALLALLAVLAGPALALAGGAVRQLLGAGAALPASGLALVAPEGAAALLPPAAALLLGALALATWLATRRLSPGAPATGPAWDCGFGPAPAHLPFGEPLTQTLPEGAAQPIRRMLGALPLRVREAHSPAAPGSPEPARLRVTAHDRTASALLLPLERLRRAAAREAERLRDLPLRHFVLLAFGTLCALLALLAWLERFA